MKDNNYLFQHLSPQTMKYIINNAQAFNYGEIRYMHFINVYL